MAFAGSEKGICELSNDADAEATIFNMDCSNALTLWHQYRDQYSQRPTVVISLKDPGLKNTFYVPKPINLDLLVNMIKSSQNLETAEQQLPKQDTIEQSHSAISTHNSDHNRTTSEETPTDQETLETPQEDLPLTGITWDTLQIATSYYSPQEFLQGKIQEAFDLANKKNVATQLSIMAGDNWKNITIDPTRKKVISEIDDEQLEKLCTMPIICLAIKSNQFNKKETDIEKYINEGEQHEASMSQFMWKIAIWTSAGRMPAGTLPSIPIHLNHWPNFTRLKEIPNGIRIAALLSAQPSSPAIVAKVLKIPINQVSTFYAASRALGLATSTTKEATSTTRLKATPKSNHHTLFGRILQRLGNPD